jgi:hypothetical protein
MCFQMLMYNQKSQLGLARSCEVLDIAIFVIQLQRLWVRNCATRFQVRPRNDLLDGNFYLLPIYGVLQHGVR